MAEKKTKKTTSSGKKKSSKTEYVSQGSNVKTYAEKQQIYSIVFFAVSLFMCCFAFIPGENVWAGIRGVLFSFFGTGYFLLIAAFISIAIICVNTKTFALRKSPLRFVIISFVITVCFSSVIHIAINNSGVGGFTLWWNQLKQATETGFNVSFNGMHLTGGIIGSALGSLFLLAFGKSAALITFVIIIVVLLVILIVMTRGIVDVKNKELNEKKKQERQEERKIKQLEKKDAKREEKRIRQEKIEEEKRREQEEAAKVLIELEEKQKKEELKKMQLSDNDFNNIFNKGKSDYSKPGDDPIAHSKDPSFRFTNDHKDNPYIPDLPHYDKNTVGIFTDLSSKDSDHEPDLETDKQSHQMSFDDKKNEELFESANAEALEKQKKTIEKTKNATDSSSVKKHEYNLPPISCLKDPEFRNEDFTAEMRITSEKLLNTLKDFGVETSLVGVSRGPSVTRYELQPAPGVKISKITNLSDDIALALAASGVRIEAPIPNKAAIGIEIPNRKRATVTFKEIVTSEKFKSDSQKSKLTVALGKDISGSVNCTDLAKMPHLLIAGTTGSGKSVCLNGMIVSILYNAKPEEVKFLLIDPKQVEFSVYNGIPHLLVPVISDSRKAAGALAWAVSEMEVRYKQFSECGVRDITGFNAFCEKHPEYQKMSQVVIFIDELNDLMMVSPKEVEDSICRLAQKARAAGMHLVVATQRPSVDVITGLIKANIPSRLSLSVSSQVDSRTILDSIGAEKLLGNGDMLFNPVGVSKPVRIQGSFLSESEIEKIVDFIKKESDSEYDDEISEKIDELAKQELSSKKSGAGSDDGDGDERDEMFFSAVEVVVELGQASTTLLQRKLRLGYARAARVMEQLEENGIVGPADGSKPRKVLMTKDQLLELKATGNFG